MSGRSTSPRTIVSRASSPRSSSRAILPRATASRSLSRTPPRANLTYKELEELNLSRSRTQSRSSPNQKTYIEEKKKKLQQFKNDNTRYKDLKKLKFSINHYKITTLAEFDEKYKSKIKKLERELREYKLHNKRIWDNLKLIRKNLDSKDVFFKKALLKSYVKELDYMFKEVLST
jgi:hypothetical protein